MINGDRAILHSDANCFYASVETVLNPDLIGKAVAVCGSPEQRHGIVLAKSEKAKKYGVKTGMANWQAKQCCPELIIVPPQYEYYLKFSKYIQKIYSRYTNLIEPFGMDECWLDVSASPRDAIEIAQTIREEVREELGLTVSIGVSFNKIFAKLGSDMKKPDAITVITKDNFKEKIWPLAADEMIYIGHSTIRNLNKFGIKTIGDLAHTDREFLQKEFGVNGLKMWQNANGLDASRVCCEGYSAPIKSIGHGTTCACDLENDSEIWKVMYELSQDIGHRLKVYQYDATAIQLTIRANDLVFSQFQCKLETRTQLPYEIAKKAFSLYKDKYVTSGKVRAISIRAINLVESKIERQIDLFIDNEERDKKIKIHDTVENIRDKYGDKSVTYASLVGDIKIPNDRRELVRMPGQMYI